MSESPCLDARCQRASLRGSYRLRTSVPASFGRPVPIITVGEVRVMVTGSARFIGSHVVESFEAAGHEVSGLDLRDGADLRDRDTLDRLLPEVDLVVHQAAKVGLGVNVA